MSILEPLTNPLFLIPTGLVVIWDFLTLLFYFKWLKAGNLQKVKWLLVSKPISTIICIYFMFTQFGAGFFLGAVYMLLSPIIAIIMFIVFVIQSIGLRNELGFPNKNYIINLSLGLLIVVSIAVPSLAYSPIKEKCATSNSAKTLIISQAMTKYFVENGKYPKQLDELIPSYISSLPSPSCDFLFGVSQQFSARVCEGDEPMIYVITIDGMGFDFYNFKDGSHSRIHSFLDRPDPGYCP